MRADIQLAVDTMFATPDGFFGLRQEYRDELEIAALIGSGRFPPTLVPPQYHAIDIGEDAPIKCLRNGLWLCREGELRYAVLLSRGMTTSNRSRKSRSPSLTLRRQRRSRNAALTSWRRQS
jgi:hypothetical protein